LKFNNSISQRKREKEREREREREERREWKARATEKALINRVMKREKIS